MLGAFFARFVHFCYRPAAFVTPTLQGYGYRAEVSETGDMVKCPAIRMLFAVLSTEIVVFSRFALRSDVSPLSRGERGW